MLQWKFSVILLLLLSTECIRVYSVKWPLFAWKRPRFDGNRCDTIERDSSNSPPSEYRAGNLQPHTPRMDINNGLACLANALRSGSCWEVRVCHSINTWLPIIFLHLKTELSG
ncbi:hypothetical protein Ciccas_004894 [Cichlidogyrus casuarinus]|uniref:Secreted protein n=1 Tax=Cichlidogyrus casuarinus TaxID=1844966 RepID=A0ABD2QA83_9PLAT